MGECQILQIPVILDSNHKPLKGRFQNRYLLSQLLHTMAGPGGDVIKAANRKDQRKKITWILVFTVK